LKKVGERFFVQVVLQDEVWLLGVAWLLREERPFGRIEFAIGCRSEIIISQFNRRIAVQVQSSLFNALQSSLDGW
jgi:hypothetical protein